MRWGAPIAIGPLTEMSDRIASVVLGLITHTMRVATAISLSLVVNLFCMALASLGTSGSPVEFPVLIIVTIVWWPGFIFTECFVPLDAIRGDCSDGFLFVAILFCMFLYAVLAYIVLWRRANRWGAGEMIALSLK